MLVSQFLSSDLATARVASQSTSGVGVLLDVIGQSLSLVNHNDDVRAVALSPELRV